MLNVFETLFATAMLAFGCGAFTVFVDPYHERIVDGTVEGRILQVGFHLVALLLYFLYAKRIIRGIREAPWLFVLAIFALCSTVWSQDPDVSLRRSLLLMSTTTFGFYFGTRFTLTKQLNIVAWALLLFLTGSAALAVCNPTLGVESGKFLGLWRGLSGQKNELARLAVLSTLVFLMWKPRYRFLRYFAIAFAIMVLAMTRSSTGFVVLLAFFLGVPLLRLLRTRSKLTITVAVFVLVTGVASAIPLLKNSHFAAALDLLGRDTTLTGRTDIWHAALVSISKRPLLGYGFDAFWLGMRGESAWIISSVRWLAMSAHNGALELCLNLGVIGLLLFVIALLVSLRKALRFYGRQQTRLHVWPLAYLIFLCLYNVTEVTVLEPNTIFTMLFAAVSVTITLRTVEIQKTYDPMESRVHSLIDDECVPTYNS